jgi:hypothetical protein
MPAVLKGKDQRDRGVDVRELISRGIGRSVSRCVSHRFPGDVTGKEAWKMKIWKMKIKSMAVVPAALAAAVVLIASPASAAGGHIGFGFNARNITGAPAGGAVTLTGGGSYDPATGFVKSAGGFRCTSDVGGQQGMLLAGCLAGQGVRWDTAELLQNTAFTCTGESEPLVSTDNHTVVLLADFYRAGDGNDESFTAKMIVSDHDIAPNNVPGIQNVWIQGVGCATAIAANFSGR